MAAFVKVKTGSKFEDIASYSRAVAIDNLIFVSNTAGRNPETNEIPDDVVEQLHQVFANIDKALKAIDSSLQEIVSYRIYVPNAENIEKIAPILGEYFKDIDPTSTLICSPLAAPYYKVEMEVIAHRKASQLQPTYINTNS